MKLTAAARCYLPGIVRRSLSRLARMEPAAFAAAHPLSRRCGFV